MRNLEKNIFGGNQCNFWWNSVDFWCPNSTPQGVPVPNFYLFFRHVYLVLFALAQIFGLSTTKSQFLNFLKKKCTLSQMPLND
jgi:hypothetical protein